MNLLFDTNIILDIALKREPHYETSELVFKKADNSSIRGFITTTTISDIYYIAKKEKGHTTAINFIGALLQVVGVIGIDKEIIIGALESGFSDFEDAIQSVASNFNGIDFIITRNAKDFESSEVAAITPTDFLTQFNKLTLKDYESLA